jgi:hypothetical protein
MLAEKLLEGGFVNGIVAGGSEMIAEDFESRIESGVDVLLKDVREAPVAVGVFEKNGNTATGKEQRFGDELEIGRDGSLRREIEEIF